MRSRVQGLTDLLHCCVACFTRHGAGFVQYRFACSSLLTALHQRPAMLICLTQVELEAQRGAGLELQRAQAELQECKAQLTALKTERDQAQHRRLQEAEARAKAQVCGSAQCPGYVLHRGVCWELFALQGKQDSHVLLLLRSYQLSPSNKWCVIATVAY